MHYCKLGGVNTPLEAMEVKKIYFVDEEMRSTKLGAEMGKIT
jgi:hypothetical protein